ncbi:MAG TPA: nuclear transport factor 2 family protein [Steroidobacteraceae bacterium]
MTLGEAELAVRRLIARFANSLDAKAWDELGECLAAAVYVDFSEPQGRLPEEVSRREFIDARRTALEHVQTQHLTGNVEIYINGTSATARLSAMILRRREGEPTSKTHCQFLLGFECREQSWAICSIVQRVLWSDPAGSAEHSENA